MIARIGTDDDVCAQYEAAGFSGFVVKAHHESTVGRAVALSRHTTMDVVGGIALNHALGGVNPSAVLTALETGGRVVWFPTSDSHTQAEAALQRLGDLDATNALGVASWGWSSGSVRLKHIAASESLW